MTKGSFIYITELYSSNCLFEAIKAKIKNPSSVTIYFCKPRITENGNFQWLHFMWADQTTVTIFQMMKKLNCRGIVHSGTKDVLGNSKKVLQNDILIIETKGDNHMKMKHKFYIWLFCIVIVINVCWQLLELLIYGEIQPRIVDNIVGLLWTGAICFAYKFKELELKRMLKKYNKVQINATWWLRKPIPPEMYTGYASDRIWLQSEYELGNKGGFTET